MRLAPVPVAGPSRLAWPQEVHGQIFLPLFICFPVSGGAEFFVLQFVQCADLLPEVQAIHAAYFIE
jgi:hypothetical protein